MSDDIVIGREGTKRLVEIHALGRVFGQSRDLPLSYESRESVDDKFLADLEQDDHICVFGGSKQGKTSLRKKHLDKSQFRRINCQATWDLRQLHQAVLKAAGYEVVQSVSRTAAGKNKVAITLNAALTFIGIGGFGAATTQESEKSNETKTTSAAIELDPEDTNDIIAALNAANVPRFFVLEDFHYLPEETQQQFAFALKTFYDESSYIFIIVGVWLDESRLSFYNGDLHGRIANINADVWSDKQLLDVIANGEALLNVSFPIAWRTELVQRCGQSVYIVQEACLDVCRQSGVKETARKHVDLTPTEGALEAIRHVVDRQSATYRKLIDGIAAGFRHSKLQMYRWIMYAVFSTDRADLERGVEFKKIKDLIIGRHPVKGVLAPANISNALRSLGSLQIEMRVRPIVFDYPESERKLRVVDRSFLFWLDHQSRNDLIALLDLDYEERQLKLGVDPYDSTEPDTITLQIQARDYAHE